jgi:hypothetical protein
MVDHQAKIFCKNLENQFSAKIVLKNFRMKIRNKNFCGKFLSQTAVMELPHA